MHRRDYILKLIEEMTQTIGKAVFNLQRQQKHPDAFELLEGYFARLYLPKSKVLVGLSEADLLALFRTNDIVETDKMAAASLLLHQEAEVLRAMDKETESYNRAVTALLLRCEAALQDDRTPPANHAPQVEALLIALDRYNLPPLVLKRLTAYFELIGRFDQAENMLYRLLAAEAGTPPVSQRYAEAVAFGESFYVRLLAESDDVLAAGGLPRDEAEDGLAALRSRRPPDSI